MTSPIALRLYYFVSFAALGVYLPFFPPWLASRGIDGLALGLVTATFPAMGILGPPAFGFVADALGLRGHLLRVACGGAFLGFAAIAALGIFGVPTFAALFLAVLVFGFFRSPMVMMADVVALEQSRLLGLPYGETRLFGSLGFLLAAGAGGRVIDPKAAAHVPIAIAALLLATFVTTFTLPGRVPVPARPAATHVRSFLANPDFSLFLLGAFLAQAAFACYDQCFSLLLLARGATPAVVGVAWALGVLAEVALMAKASAIAARVSPPALLAAAYASASLRWALVGALPGVWPLLCLQPLHATSFALAWVSSLAYIKDRAPPLMLATTQGVFTATVSAGSVTGMLVWIQIYRAAGGAVAFGGAAVVSAVASLCAVGFARRVREGRTAGAP